MAGTKKHIDPWSWIVMAVTSALFITALFRKGLTHDVLLEAGVFLVSVKLIMMAYKNSVSATELKGRLDDVQAALARLEELLQRAPRPTGVTKASREKATKAKK